VVLQPDAPNAAIVVQPASGPTETPIGPAVTVGRPACSPPDLGNPLNPSNELLGRLGCPSQGYVAARAVSVQHFERGVIVAFARGASVDGPGGAIYALALDGRAWRLVGAWRAGPAYSCDRDAADGAPPSQTRTPWRQIGKAWCDNADVKSALGAAIGDPTDATAAFQSYTNGRAFRVSTAGDPTPIALDRTVAVMLSTDRDGDWSSP
jgi:hypothetical protein